MRKREDILRIVNNIMGSSDDLEDWLKSLPPDSNPCSGHTYVCPLEAYFIERYSLNTTVGTMAFHVYLLDNTFTHSPWMLRFIQFVDEEGGWTSLTAKGLLQILEESKKHVE